MDGNLGHLPVKILCVSLLLFLSLPNAVNGIEEEELQDMISAVRSRGYTLFGNAVMTSVLQEEILSGTSLTFFIPTDSSLFALGFRSSADHYLQTLRCHVVTSRRLSASTLRSLPHSGSFLPTLQQRRTVFVTSRPADFVTGSQIITVDGIDVVAPGLFYGRNIAVHGLGGVLSTRSRAGVLRSPRSSDWPGNQDYLPAPSAIQSPLPGISLPSFPASGSPESPGSLELPPGLRILTPAHGPSVILSPYASMPPETATTPAPSSIRGKANGGSEGGDPSQRIDDQVSPVPGPGIRRQSLSRQEMGEDREGLSHQGIHRGRPRPCHLHVDSRNDFF